MLGNGIYVSTSLTLVGCTELNKNILKNCSLVSDLLNENISLLRFNGRLSGSGLIRMSPSRPWKSRDIAVQIIGLGLLHTRLEKNEFMGEGFLRVDHYSCS
jgi:hypothetical protein